MHHIRPHDHDIRAIKQGGEKMSMLYVNTPDEAAAAAAGIHMLSIEGKVFDAEMREAAEDCFVQVGLGHHGSDEWAGLCCWQT